MDFAYSLFNLIDRVFLAECLQIVILFVETALNLEHIKQRCSSEFLGVWLQKNVICSLFFKCICQLARSVKIEVLKKSLSELSEAVRVDVFFSENYRQSNLGKSIAIERNNIALRLVSLRLWLVLASTEQEARHHVSHQVLIAQSYHIQVRIAECLRVSEQCGKQTITSFRGEAAHKHPVEQPLRLVQHLHRQLGKPRLDDVFQFANRDLFDAFSCLAVLNFTRKQAP